MLGFLAVSCRNLAKINAHAPVMAPIIHHAFGGKSPKFFNKKGAPKAYNPSGEGLYFRALIKPGCSEGHEKKIIHVNSAKAMMDSRRV